MGMLEPILSAARTRGFPVRFSLWAPVVLVLSFRVQLVPVGPSYQNVDHDQDQLLDSSVSGPDPVEECCDDVTLQNRLLLRSLNAAQSFCDLHL
ncbi:hypothetical protein FQA47_013178 [Oryzias melastigma]|uniref:Uncharacterized protein n=1 Tax=Oryzias melastigma TaxID=30732 RepID=A0A834KX64_ORYME|nr:hypothetical protein FQA47_013178 [Oryzias melastigma]